MPATLLALKFILHKMDSKYSGLSVDIKKVVTEVVVILLEKNPPYSTLLPAFELLYSLLKITNVQNLMKKSEDLNINPLDENPLGSQELPIQDQNETYAKFLAKSLCEKYLFDETDFLPDSGNSRVSIKTQLILIISSLVGCDKTLIDLEVFERPITSISQFSNHSDPGLKGAVASFVSRIIVTAPPDVLKYVETLSALLSDQSHQAVIRAIQGVRFCVRTLLRSDSSLGVRLVAQVVNLTKHVTYWADEIEIINCIAIIDWRLIHHLSTTSPELQKSEEMAVRFFIRCLKSKDSRIRDAALEHVVTFATGLVGPRIEYKFFQIFHFSITTSKIL